MWWCRSCLCVEFKGKRRCLLCQSLVGVLQARGCHSSPFASDGKCLFPVAPYCLCQTGVCGGLWVLVVELCSEHLESGTLSVVSFPSLTSSVSLFSKGRIVYSGKVLQSTSTSAPLLQVGGPVEGVPLCFAMV